MSNQFTAFLTGRLVTAPTPKPTTARNLCATFRLAVDDFDRNAEGELQKIQTVHHDVLLLGPLAERARQTLQPGDAVIACGEFRIHSAGDGTNHAARPITTFVASNVAPDITQMNVTIRRRTTPPPAKADPHLQPEAARGDVVHEELRMPVARNFEKSEVRVGDGA